MKKLFVILAAAFVFVGVVYGVYVTWYLPMVIEKYEARTPVIQQALAEVSNDQLLLSKTVGQITENAVRNSNGKAKALLEMLSDSHINRLALNYLGVDFSMYKSSYIGQLKHIRNMGKIQGDKHRKAIKSEEDLKEKIKRLESRKKFLLLTRSTLRNDRHRSWRQWASWEREMDDIDSQIHYLRGLDWGNVLTKGKTNSAEEEARMQREKLIFRVASDYEMQTVIPLERAIAAKRKFYMEESLFATCLRERLDSLAFWPLTVALKDAADGR